MHTCYQDIPMQIEFWKFLCLCAHGFLGVVQSNSLMSFSCAYFILLPYDKASLLKYYAY